MQRHAHGEGGAVVGDFDVAARDQVPAVAQVLQPDAGRRFGFELGDLGVRHHEQALFGADRDVERLGAGDRIVLDGVVDERLQREGREFPPEVFLVDVDIEKE